MPKGILFVYNRSMKKIIAVVEDEKDLNELVSRYLEKEGFQVVSFLVFRYYLLLQYGFTIVHHL